MIAVKLDEDLPEELGLLLSEHGFDSASVRSQGWSGWPDERIFAATQKEGRWLFTADKGFSDIRRYSPGSHHGIVFFRAERESRAAYLRLASLLVEKVDLATSRGALIVVSHRGVRIARAPGGRRTLTGIAVHRR